ncbi:Hypothetical Protein FCC1311_106142 [Hondaea fermentalgiana]|uniref:Uncharacterized protein n=1 Tax=Hondaea fermentalgiana TaxID=2315210 RepID=A0A2R5GU63_9STRA|nr:Hypothetical Protein FCC1311_106142 [Hondaea fermentalgiana]|eukprot:GBG34390.1 Hypothetical Protein FCC1311_106142 [Hondaea fermentalgiana]
MAEAASDPRARLQSLLLPFVGRWWFPWVVGALSAVNNFVVVLSAPLVVLFMSAVLARPERRALTAIANAAGVTAGAAVLVYLGSASEVFPTFALEDFERTKKLVEEYGAFGCALYSCLPIILHPLIFFALALKVDPAMLIGAIFVGRTIKYLVMAQLAVSGSAYLKLFGSTAVNAATKADESVKKAQ